MQLLFLLEKTNTMKCILFISLASISVIVNDLINPFKICSYEKAILPFEKQVCNFVGDIQIKKK